MEAIVGMLMGIWMGVAAARQFSRVEARTFRDASFKCSEANSNLLVMGVTGYFECTNGLRGKIE